MLSRESTSLLHSPGEPPFPGTWEAGSGASPACGPQHCVLGTPPFPQPHSGPSPLSRHFLHSFPRANQPACHPPPPGTAAPLLSPGTSKGPDMLSLQQLFPAKVAQLALGLSCAAHFPILKKNPKHGSCFSSHPEHQHQIGALLVTVPAQGPALEHPRGHGGDVISTA